MKYKVQWEETLRGDFIIEVDDDGIDDVWNKAVEELGEFDYMTTLYWSDLNVIDVTPVVEEVTNA